MKIKKLSEIAEIDISGVDKKTNPGEKPVKLCNFTDVYYNWSVSNSDVPNFMDASAKDTEIERFSLKKGYVAITKDSETRDDIGISCLITENLENTILGYHCALIIPNEEIVDGGYLNACLQTKMSRTYFSNQASGSGQRYTLSVNGIGSVKVPIIPLEEQKKIANLLDSIDRKIRVNNTINDNLQQILMESYIQQFECFCGYGSFIFNEKLKRKIPETWIPIQIKEIASILSGYPFDSSKYTPDGEYKLITIKNVQDSGIDLHSGDRISLLPADLPEYCKLLPGDVLLSLTGNVGRIGLMFADRCLLNQRVASIKPHNKQKMPYLFCLFKSERLRTQMERIAGGTSQKNLSPIETENLYIPYDEKTVANFSKKMLPLFNKMICTLDENRRLVTLRTELLPLLMNGQVTIQD